MNPDASNASMYDVPAYGLSMADFTRKPILSVVPDNANINVGAGLSLGDVANTQASVSASFSPRQFVVGFLVSVGILTAIRVIWEVAEDAS